MTSLRFNDGGCAAMTHAVCKAFRAWPAPFVIEAAQRRSHSSFVIMALLNIVK
ncbi:MAG: hypothetical protein Q4G70_16140 [Pseudomonadota bacterium]|nr:hypothetical protein [Pseudomonadota bacterium]